MFITTGQITGLGGAPIAGFEAVQCSVWPSGDRRTAGGEAYDYTGEVEWDAAAALGEPNRRLVVDGHSYMIVSATAMEILPHVAVRLRRMGASGGV